MYNASVFYRLGRLAPHLLFCVWRRIDHRLIPRLYRIYLSEVTQLKWLHISLTVIYLMNYNFLDHSSYNTFLKWLIFKFKIISNFNLKIRFMRNYFFQIWHQWFAFDLAYCIVAASLKTICNTSFSCNEFCETIRNENIISWDWLIYFYFLSTIFSCEILKTKISHGVNKVSVSLSVYSSLIRAFLVNMQHNLKTSWRTSLGFLCDGEKQFCWESMDLNALFRKRQHV